MNEKYNIYKITNFFLSSFSFSWLLQGNKMLQRLELVEKLKIHLRLVICEKFQIFFHAQLMTLKYFSYSAHQQHLQQMANNK